MMKQELLYEGKAKQIYATANPEQVVMYYKDDATAFNGIKKSVITDKGRLNAAITNELFSYLAANGIPTHLIEQLNEREQLCHTVTIFPLEVIVRNIATGSLTKRLAIKEGTRFAQPIFELCFKNDDLGDPLINDDHAIALGLITPAQLIEVKQLTLKINQLLQQRFQDLGIDLVDFKVEFGTKADGTIVLADEISPDSCRFWEQETARKLDKDRFRQDLGDVTQAYEEILARLLG
ncbi:MAG: phosphoribosylaminoimidazolesuccinocarboxamide synthase [Culicoidibacterales bacterium]